MTDERHCPGYGGKSFVALEGETGLSQHGLHAESFSHPSRQDVYLDTISRPDFAWHVNIGVNIAE